MIDRHLIEKKLRKIEEFLREFEKIDVPSFEEFTRDIVVKRFIERNIELSIEQMVDICKHLVSRLNLQEPETYSECMEIIADEGIIHSNDLETFKSMIKFRNILIHAYEGVDDTITYGIYKNRLNDFRKFIASIRKYMKNIKNTSQ